MLLNINITPPLGGQTLQRTTSVIAISAVIAAGDLSGTATATINIEKRASSGLQVAPEPLLFSVSVSAFDSTAPAGGAVFDDRLHDIEYFWDFDSLNAGGTYTFDAPVNVYSAAGLHTNGKKNSRYARGFLASHTYRTAGTYRVSVFCVEPSSGKTATGTLDVTIGDPDTLFPTTQTIFMSPSGDFTDAPAGAVEVTSGNIVSAITTYTDGQETTPYRIMLNRGESFTFSGRVVGSFNGGQPTTHIVAGPGAGAKPVVSWTGDLGWADSGSSEPANSKSLVLQNLVCNGTWDDTTATDNTGSVGFFRINENGPNIIVADGCEIDGIGYAALDAVTSGTNGHSYFFNDFVCTGRSYGLITGSATHHVVTTGSRWMSSVDAQVDATTNQGWNLRFSSPNSRNVVDKCDFYGRQGWSLVGSIIAVQGHVRFNFEGDTNAQCVVTDCTMEAGFNAIGLSATSGNNDLPVNMLIDGNYLLGSYQSISFIQTNQSGLTIRNNIMVMPDITGTDRVSNGFGAFVELVTNGRSAGTNASEPIRIYNNTFVNNQPDSKNGGTGATSLVSNTLPFTNVTTENNVNHQPALDVASPITTYAPLGDDTNLFTPRELGYKSSTADLQADTATVTTAGATDIYEPEAGSSAISGATTGLVSDRDWIGRRRSGTPSIGAMEQA